MDGSSVVWENKDWNGGGKLKKITSKTLLINFPFDWKYLLSNMWRKPLNRVGKTDLKTLQKSCRKQHPNPQIYRARKTSRWDPSGLSVDRGLSREQSSLDGRPGRSTGLQSELGVHVCARPGRPTSSFGQRPGRPTSSFGRPVGRPAEARADLK